MLHRPSVIMLRSALLLTVAHGAHHQEQHNEALSLDVHADGSLSASGGHDSSLTGGSSSSSSGGRQAKSQALALDVQADGSLHVAAASSFHVASSSSSSSSSHTVSGRHGSNSGGGSHARDKGGIGNAGRSSTLTQRASQVKRRKLVRREAAPVVEAPTPAPAPQASESAAAVEAAAGAVEERRQSPIPEKSA